MSKVMKYVIEAIVVLAVLLAAYYGISKINTSVTRNNLKNVTVTFEAQNLEEGILSKVAVGDDVTDNAKTTYLGEIVSISENRPYTKATKNYDTNTVVQSPVEGRYNKDIVVEIQADVSDFTVMAGETEIKIGYTIPLINEKYMVNCIVTDIEIAE